MKQAIRERYGGTTISLTGRGSMVPNEDCYCEIDPDMKDKWGIPVLRFHWKWSDYEIESGAPHARELPRDPRDARRHGERGRGRWRRRAAPAGAPHEARRDAGASAAPAADPPDDRAALGAGGGIIHEVGCVRMGDDPKTSVVNKFCRAHDVPNVFSADGGPFVSHGDKNPTHTIIALAWRTAEYLAEEMRKGNV